MSVIEATLGVGDEIVLKKAVFTAGWTLIYAGMPSPYVFGVVLMWKSGYQAAAYNLYFPAETRGFDAAKGRVTVTGVDRESLRLRFEKR